LYREGYLIVARRRKPEDDLAAATANRVQSIPAGPIKADFEKMMAGYRKRHDGWNQQRLQRFLDVLAYTGCVEDACRVAGMSDVAPYRAKKRFPLFSVAWDDALERAQQGLVAIAFQRAVEGRETVIIRKGEEYERRIQPSDSMLGLLIKRGDMLGSGAGSRGGAGAMLSFAEWLSDIRFDPQGRKVQQADPAQNAEDFVAKMATLRRRLEDFADAHQACPTCSQPLPQQSYNRSVAELVALGVVDVDEL
jgi:hypothetical protein